MLHRRTLLTLAGTSAVIWFGGCAHQYAHIIRPDQANLVGSHTAGSETWNPLVDESVSKLLGRALPSNVAPVGFDSKAETCGPGTICFIGVENKSIEELADFKEIGRAHV